MLLGGQRCRQRSDVRRRALRSTPRCMILKTNRSRACLKATPEEFGDVGGDKKLQDALVEVLRVEMKKQVVKDEVEETYQEGVQQLRSIADEAKEELERLSQLNKMRANLSLDSTLADLMLEADEFEAELRKSREAMEADSREFNDWEQKIRSDQNEGLFFKGLYKADKKEGDEAGGLVDREKVAAATAAVRQPAVDEVRSPMRLYLCLYMMAVLGFAVAHDVLTPDASYGIDVLYTAIAAALGFNAYGERKALLQADEAAMKSYKNNRSSGGGSGSSSSSDSSPASPGDKDA